MNYARNVLFQIRNGKEKEFTKVFETEVLPTLRKQSGFKEEVTLLDGNRGLGISLWEDRGSAETYQTTTYPRVLEKLSPMLEGTPRVENYQVGATTLHI